MENRVTGVMIYYYFVCKRKLWYFINEINMESDNENVMLGKLLDENSYRRDDKHINIDNVINIDFINKINNAHEAGLKVIYCIGESLSDRENGNTYMVLEKQISEVLNNVSLKNIMIAYEPVWAIGTGVTPEIDEINETINFIKTTIMEKYEYKVDCLYGGSVNNENIESLCKIKNINGFLVGGASLDVTKVKDILVEMEK